MFKFAGQATKRVSFSTKWNSIALLCTREVKPQNAINHVCIKDCISLPLLPKRPFLFGSQRTLYYNKGIVKNVGLNSWCLNPNHSYILRRKFHSSDPRRAAPILPVIGAFLARFSGPIAQLLKLMAVVVGR